MVTTGDHIRKTRLDRGLSQPQVAKIIGVTTDVITNWELNRVQPKVSLYPNIIKFLGNNPFVNEYMTFGKKVKAYRFSKGLQSFALAQQIGIDQATLTRIEDDRSYKKKSYLKVLNYIDDILQSM